MTTLSRGMVVAAFVLMTLGASADTLRLADGRELTGQYEGGDARTVRFRANGGVSEFDIRTVAGVRISDAVVGSGRAPAETRYATSLDPGQERIIRAWFSSRATGREGLPPGLARRESLPPGLQRQVQRNGTLPPGLQRRIEPLPVALENELPPLVQGLARVVLGRDVLLIEVNSSRILDILTNVF